MRQDSPKVRNEPSFETSIQFLKQAFRGALGLGMRESLILRTHLARSQYRESGKPGILLTKCQIDRRQISISKVSVLIMVSFEKKKTEWRERKKINSQITP